MKNIAHCNLVTGENGATILDAEFNHIEVRMIIPEELVETSKITPIYLFKIDDSGTTKIGEFSNFENNEIIFDLAETINSYEPTTFKYQISSDSYTSEQISFRIEETLDVDSDEIYIDYREDAFYIVKTKKKDVVIDLAKNIITARLTSNYTINATNAYETLPLEKWLTVGDKLSVSKDGEVVIGEGVKVVKISGNGRISTGSVANKYLTIQNSQGQQLLQGINYKANSNGYYAFSISPAIFPVTEGETLRLRVYGAASDVWAGASQEYGMLVTYMTVEVIE